MKQGIDFGIIADELTFAGKRCKRGQAIALNISAHTEGDGMRNWHSIEVAVRLGDDGRVRLEISEED